VAVAGVQVTAEAVGNLVEGPVAELVAPPGSRGLQVFQQLVSAVPGVAVLLVAGVWRPGWDGL
jgi:H2-forming N5,N10-methylenetetrahydromethanopterin dehydrogenase-like enzyme